VNPKVARLVGKAGDLIQTDITITPPPMNIFDITGISALEGKNIQFKMETRSESNPQQFVLHISNTKPDPGRYFDKIILKTDSSISPEISIRIFGIIRE
jgi:hypothetical protein